MRSLLLRFSLMVALPLALNGCVASIPPSDPLAKAGWVYEIYSTQSLIAKPPSCLAALSREEISSKDFIEVSISHFRGHRFIAAEVPKNMKLKIGDRISVYPIDCNDGKLPVVQEILHRK
jgi:hypothetical protein